MAKPKAKTNSDWDEPLGQGRSLGGRKKNQLPTDPDPRQRSFFDASIPVIPTSSKIPVRVASEEVADDVVVVVEGEETSPVPVQPISLKEREAILKERLINGTVQIEKARKQEGNSERVSQLENFWISLLREYEQVLKEMMREEEP